MPCHFSAQNAPMVSHLEQNTWGWWPARAEHCLFLTCLWFHLPSIFVTPQLCTAMLSMLASLQFLTNQMSLSPLSPMRASLIAGYSVVTSTPTHTHPTRPISLTTFKLSVKHQNCNVATLNCPVRGASYMFLRFVFNLRTHDHLSRPLTCLC